ncbi:RIP metalloprotease RseP [Sedimenticola selenatireducens]|uniref:Zinc metalloprotease n=1 Tax=Sedimenticola selenatireducens TaxID=191960 RepID=A0A557SJX4_9GAMM|nr:RIP metalloprotease RseP [Sedimenticola selenatireducens]TVO77660.1 RIP metalloprotease RseP [Sedimenticola selenatireducens]TVT64966.1 MAG: RIP metalloprotease RseP [Sedimenticola selenatireducens]
MSSFLFSAGSFVIALAILIAVHEFGHFWVARKLGVKVLRFSIGFGKPLFSFRGKSSRSDGGSGSEAQFEADLGTEYVLAAIPLGGYVKMLDEREGAVPEHYLSQSFNRQSVVVRSAIVVAGPLFNFLFALLAFWLIAVSGDTGSRPWIGKVSESSIAAEAGFAQDDEFLSVGDTPTPTWESAVYALLTESTVGGDVVVKVRDAKGYERIRVLPGDRLLGLAEDGRLLDRLGFAPKRPIIDPVIGQLVSGEPAEQSGFKVGDRVLSIDGIEVNTWSELVEYVRQKPGKLVDVTIDRMGVTSEIKLIIGQTKQAEQVFGRIGAGPYVAENLFDDYRVEVVYGPIDAVGVAATKTAEMSLFMLKMLGRMLTGDISIKNLSGPISIAQTAGKTASYGLTQFLKFLALVSISLGVLNLLPVPVLDGGHLLFFMIEAVKGSPLSESAQVLGQRLGLVILLSLMTLAFYVDLSRLFN